MNPDVQAARAGVQERPHDPAAHYALAQAQDRAGDIAGAVGTLRAALLLAPDFAQAHNLLGLLLAVSGDIAAAIASFQQAVRLQPTYARACNNLGSSLRTVGRIAEAETAFAQAVRLQPDYQLAQHNLGAVRQELGRIEEAVAAFTVSVQLAPRFRPSWSALATAHRERGRLDDAVGAGRQAIALDPAASGPERLLLGELLTECGLQPDARQAYAEALAAQPDALPAALGLHLALPPIHADAGALEAARAQYAAGLLALERDFDRYHAHLNADATLEAWRWSNFFLAYQGRDDRPLQEQYARLLRRAIDLKAPAWRVPPPTRARPHGRIRVGFASAFFNDGTVGQYFGRWISELDPDVFDVFVYQIGGRQDAVSAEVARRADRFRHATGPATTVARLAASIRGDAPEILIYPEVGMDSRCMVLAALRLAPVQCAAWGHPVTTGQDTIDYFFTAGGMEPANADAHYTERLVRL
ncbi:MAG: tetratricopeptide repeat protein, partial [Betaproteobacteria bacterium]